MNQEDSIKYKINYLVPLDKGLHGTNTYRCSSKTEER